MKPDVNADFKPPTFSAIVDKRLWFFSSFAAVSLLFSSIWLGDKSLVESCSACCFTPVNASDNSAKPLTFLSLKT